MELYIMNSILLRGLLLIFHTMVTCTSTTSLSSCYIKPCKKKVNIDTVHYSKRFYPSFQQVVPSYSSTSLFLITSSLLSDNLTPAIYSADAGTVPSTHNINPTVCLGKYKAKLSQLNNIKQEIWRHSALMLPEKNWYAH